MPISVIVQAITIFAGLLALFCVLMGVSFIRAGMKIKFYRIRHTHQYPNPNS